MDHIEGTAQAHSLALRLIRAGLRGGEYELVADLLRWGLRAIVCSDGCDGVGCVFERRSVAAPVWALGVRGARVGWLHFKGGLWNKTVNLAGKSAGPVVVTRYSQALTA